MAQTDFEVAEERKSGFTWRSFMGILYGAVVLLPSSIWLTLTAGQDLSGIAAYAATFLVYEISRSYGSRLPKQEVFMIYTCSAMSAASWNAVALILLQNLYNRTGPVSWMFTAPAGGLCLSPSLTGTLRHLIQMHFYCAKLCIPTSFCHL